MSTHIQPVSEQALWLGPGMPVFDDNRGYLGIGMCPRYDSENRRLLSQGTILCVASGPVTPGDHVFWIPSMNILVGDLPFVTYQGFPPYAICLHNTYWLGMGRGLMEVSVGEGDGS